MFRPIADARYWFRSAREQARRPAPPGLLPPMGALVVKGADGSLETVELDYTNSTHERKLDSPLEGVVGLASRDRRGSGWACELRGEVHPASKFIGKGVALADAVQAAQTARRKSEDAEIALRENPVAHLERELMCHDWWHMMSDSYGVTLAGQRHMEDIRSLMCKIEPSMARALWSKYAPADFTCPV